MRISPAVSSAFRNQSAAFHRALNGKAGSPADFTPEVAGLSTTRIPRQLAGSADHAQLVVNPSAPRTQPHPPHSKHIIFLPNLAG